MKGEFRKGDVIVNVDGNNVYIVSDARTSRYSLLARLHGEVVHLVFDKDVIDEKYVKVDKCNSEDFAEVIDKLGDIWYNLLKGETR